MDAICSMAEMYAGRYKICSLMVSILWPTDDKYLQIYMFFI